jgi:hypothetical protein
MKFAPALISLLIVVTPAHAAETIVRCTADFSGASMGVHRVQITRMDDGRLQSQVNDEVTNRDVKVTEQPIRKNLNLDAGPGGMNQAESSLSHAHSLTKTLNPGEIKLPFDLKDARRMKTYDILGKTDKFGGSVLMEAFGEDGRLLGRLFRAVFVNGCF